MNSNFILAGLISFITYLLVIFSLVLYFNIHHKTVTVGKKESFNVEVISLQPPKPNVQQKKQIKSEQKEKTQQIQQPEQKKQPKKSTPKASIADVFNAIQPSKKVSTPPKKVEYKSSYQSQKFRSRDDVTIDSIKDVTITSVKKGDIDDPLIMELQSFLYQRWNPPRSVGIHKTTLDVKVLKSGEIIYLNSYNTKSQEFNRYVEEFKQFVVEFKPINRELRIELILQTQE